MPFIYAKRPSERVRQFGGYSNLGISSMHLLLHWNRLNFTLVVVCIWTFSPKFPNILNKIGRLFFKILSKNDIVDIASFITTVSQHNMSHNIWFLFVSLVKQMNSYEFTRIYEKKEKKLRRTTDSLFAATLKRF